MRARGLARIWRQPPKLQVAGSNPAAPAFCVFYLYMHFLYFHEKGVAHRAFAYFCLSCKC